MIKYKRPMTVQLKNLIEYYKTKFPFEYLFKFLRINKYREICFRIKNDIYIRYLSYDTVDEFRNDIMKMRPTQIDVGAFYKEIPNKNGINIFDRRELVFDVDITDYERSCKCEKQLCDDCFPIIKAAIEILNKILSVDFGFKEISFFFSGGKGVHCWVTDESTYEMRREEREAICGYISASHKSDEVIKKIMKKYSISDKNFIQIDREVTTNEKHLIKMPYVIHKNGNIACQIDVDSIYTLRLSSFENIS